MHPAIIVMNNFHGYFGTADTACIPTGSGTKSVAEHYPVLSSLINASRLSTLRQTHSTQGALLIQNNDITPLLEGDYIITQRRHHAIGVWTADCLPIFVYETSQNIIAAVHVGWRGAVHGIINNLIKQMIEQSGCFVKNMHFFLGPSAQGCCYTMSRELAHTIFNKYPTTQSLYCNNTYYFDLKTLVIEQLRAHTISLSCISVDRRCTLCQPYFYSYRTNAKTPLRQINACWLS